MPTITPDRTAAGYAVSAARFYRRARAEAQRAASCYSLASSARDHAAWVTDRPELWHLLHSPARAEDAARTWTRLGDQCLRASFRNTDTARHYNSLAASHRKAAAARQPATREIEGV